MGWTQAVSAGVFLGFLIGLMAGWVAYRSDLGARHTLANSVIYILSFAPFLGGTNLVLLHMTGLGHLSFPMWLAGVATVLVPVIGSAWQTRSRLKAEGVAGPWAHKYLDLYKGSVARDAFRSVESLQPSIVPWQIGVLAVNVPLVWRLQGGSDTSLLALALIMLVVASVWGGCSTGGASIRESMGCFGYRTTHWSAFAPSELGRCSRYAQRPLVGTLVHV